MATAEDPKFISLATAIDRYRQEKGAFSNSYEWYRKQAHSDGHISIAGVNIPVSKIRNQWHLREQDLEQAILQHKLALKELRKITEDYHSRILHGNDGAAVHTEWGGYKIKNSFHFVWSDMDKYRKKSDGSWICNLCFELAGLEHNREECHLCADWGGCGRDCTLSRVFCTQCKTTMEV